MPELILKDESFRILAVHSVRLTPENAGERADRLGRMIREARPALLVLNGDTLASPVSKDEAADALGKFLRPLTEAGIPWLYAFGEGERRTGLDLSALAEVFSSVPGCANGKTAEDTDGYTDCAVPVIRQEGDAPALMLRLFDTHAETTAYEKDYGSPGRSRLPYPLYSRFYMDGVRFHQTIWFDRDRDRLTAEYGKKIPEIFFFHTPTPEHAQLPLNQGSGGFDGVYREDSRCQTVNGGIAMAAAESGAVKAIVCGHETVNDYYASWAGMLLGVEPSFENGAWVIEARGTQSAESVEIRVHRVSSVG